MFQDFESRADPSKGPERVASLRARLAASGLDGFLVPRADPHQGEYLPPDAERLAWLTGFTGSAGAAAVIKDRAALFVDGRYTLQARDQVDTGTFEIVHIVDTGIEGWLEQALPAAARLGFDPWLHTVNGVKKLEALCRRVGCDLVAVEDNPVDAIWTDRPAPPRAPAVPHPLDHAGETAADKVARVADRIVQGRADAAVLNQAESVAWLFNIRGHDLAHTPLALAFAIVPAHGRPTVFIDRAKLSNATTAHLDAVAEIAPPEALGAALDALAGKSVRLDPAGAPAFIARRLEAAGARIVEAEDPVVLPRAIKNAAEITGARAAHLRDGAAFARFLAWFDREAPKGTLDEIAAAEALERFRAGTGALKDIAFDTISGAGPNGAIVHYRVTRRTNRRIEPGSLYLVDSGGQYLDGTTDITRTLPVGTASAEMRRHFTLVLKGHIAIATARFPEGASGAQLDTLARWALWQAGLDYDHGTGHGVGSYLGVHEGPQRIAKTGTARLEAGMILSNEPGYYRAGAYGIRIENLVLVTPAESVPGGDKRLHAFETLTLAPIDTRLVDPSLMTADEIGWLDAYHARVRAALAPLVEVDTRAWLEAATQPVGTGV